MNRPQDTILVNLAIARHNRKFTERFYKTLAESSVFTLVRPGRREFIISDIIDGEKREYISCFSNSDIAKRTLAFFKNLPGNEGISVEVQNVAAEKLFFSAAARRYPIFLNPKSRPHERLFFSLEKVLSLLDAYWTPGGNSPTAAQSKPSGLKRSRRGRRPVEDSSTQIPIADIDFTHYYTSAQIAGIFGVSENDVTRMISELEGDGIIDLDEISVCLETGRAARHYDPLVVHLVGHKIQNHRGEEFRAFQAQLLTEYCLRSNAAAAEIAALKSQIAKLEKSNEDMAAVIAEQAELVKSLQNTPAGLDEAIYRLNQELVSAARRIDDLKNELAASGRWDVPGSVMEAMRMAEGRYRARLVFHERVIQSIDDFSLKNDLRATHEAVKMFKALAEELYKQKFEDENFSEERFRDETGIQLSMTESKASKRDKALDNTRSYLYKGATLYAYPHLKANIHGVQVRLHFQFLENEKKILVCHFGRHLPNAKTKFL